MVYEPREDSFLLAKEVEKYAFGKVLDMGTGSGIQAETAHKTSQEVHAVDIQEDVVNKLKDKIAAGNFPDIRITTSNLFSSVTEKYDTIIFNAPYLPQDPGIEDPEIYGGPKGYETLVQFLNELPPYLRQSGISLIAFSSHTKPNVVKEAIHNNLLTAREVATQKVEFEELLVWMVQKDPLRITLEKEGITNIKFLDRGRRGKVFIGKYKTKEGIKEVVIKTLRDDAPVDTIEHETKMLKAVNRRGIGPKVIKATKKYIIMEYADGEFLGDWVMNRPAREIKLALREVIEQCYTLDKMNINKDEMHRPIKHIIMANNKPVFIDFDRARRHEKPKNVTQILQFFGSKEFNLRIFDRGVILFKMN